VYGRHVGDERGASAVEYALLVAAIAAVIVVVVFGLGRVVNRTFETTSNNIDCLASGPC
jgi:pilus assembly protein Flp/PilA